MADMFKRNHCLGDSAKCARHQVFEALERGRVPSDLYPNDQEYVDRVLAAR